MLLAKRLARAGRPKLTMMMAHWGATFAGQQRASRAAPLFSAHHQPARPSGPPTARTVAALLARAGRLFTAAPQALSKQVQPQAGAALQPPKVHESRVQNPSASGAKPDASTQRNQRNQPLGSQGQKSLKTSLNSQQLSTRRRAPALRRTQADTQRICAERNTGESAPFFRHEA